MSYLTENYTRVPNEPLAEFSTGGVCCLPGSQRSELMFAEILKVHDDGKHASVRVGAGTTNDQLRRWSIENGWTLPLNVILVEVTIAGTTSTACHGAGIKTPTLSDLITEIEFVNTNGDIQVPLLKRPSSLISTLVRYNSIR